MTSITAILSLGVIYCTYYLFFEFFFETNNFQSQYSLINKIYNSYLFYLISIIFKVLLGFTIFGLIMVPIGTIVTGFFGDNIFDIIDKKNIKKYKFKRKNNAFYLSLRFSIICALRTTFLNILIIPLYFFIPIGNLFIFVFVNGYFISKEFLGNFLIQFHNKNYVNNFYSSRSTELYFLGCMIAFLYTIPLINFFIPFISNVLFTNIILGNKIKITS
ncbi:EI24 domain-containing protein [Candidatus Pelagibacter sp.]|nr:EI24 domain-containing protein [Candidatus Pelagibacter sp.]